MVQWWQKQGVMVILLFSAGVMVLSFYSLARRIGQPFGGFLTYYNGIASGWLANRTTPLWWPGISGSTACETVNEGHNQVQYEDRMMAIDGKIYDERTVAAIYGEVYQRHPPVTTLVVGRNGQEQTLLVCVIPFNLTHFLDLKLPAVIQGFCFWLVGFMVYRSRPEHPINRIFTIACCWQAMTSACWRTGLFFDQDILDKVLSFFVITAISPINGSIVFHLALLFPKPIRYNYRPVLYLIYGISLVFSAMYGLSRFVFWCCSWSPLVSWLDAQAFYYSWYAGVLGSSILWIRVLYHFLLKQTSKRERRQALLLLIGIAISSIFYIPAATNSLIGNKISLFWNQLDSRYFTLMAPLFIAFTILRYQLFHNPKPWFLLLPILALSGFLANVQVILWHNYAHFSPFAIAFVVLFSFTALWVAQLRWQGALGRLLHWQQIGYEAVNRFGQQLVGQQDMATLPDHLSRALVQELQVEQAGLWLWRPMWGWFVPAGHAGQLPTPLPAGLYPIPAELTAFTRPVRLNISHPAPAAWLRAIPQPFELAVPLLVSGRAIGLLILGKRWDEEIFDERDLVIIDLIAQQSSLFLQTAQQIAEIRQIPDLLDQTQTQERDRISQELHDTVQQFFGRLPFALERCRQNPAQSDTILYQTILDVKENARTLRQIRYDLTSSAVAQGLSQPLGNLVARSEQNSGITTHLQLPTDLDNLLTDSKKRHALYRVIGQALDNAAQHANPTEITITLAAEPPWLTFAISDNGRGSSEAERKEAQAHGSFGLISMQTRIQNVGGEFELYSSLGQGTVISGRVPLLP